MIYLDNAATSYPKAPGVAEAVAECIQFGAGGPDRSLGASATAQARAIFQTRESLARLLGCRDSADMVLTPGATFSLNLAISGLARPGDHVITTALEHNAVARPLTHLESLGSTITRVACPDGFAPEPGAFRAALRPNTALIAVVHASNVSGTILPVAEIAATAREAGVPLLVDASQTVGAVPIDIDADACHMLAFPGHKGLLGPAGIGGLYIDARLDVGPLHRGGTGSRSYSAEHPSERPDCFEAGTPNIPGIAGLGVGARYLLERGVVDVRQHEMGLIAALLDGLSAVGGVNILGPRAAKDRAGLVSFNVGTMDPAEVGMRLEQDYGIITRCGFHCSAWAHEALGTVGRGAVRMSVSPFTTDDEIAEAVQAVGEIASAQ
ncbi:MAG TPA: aminotransferase class V-fold PLP-dependent enzyme [Armatimonadota bacterium]|jgi:cysteine desulfurase family protein|nr:aminotransferase class V-fold PLP-dependent enzyme [Armatimonadota bacterium]